MNRHVEQVHDWVRRVGAWANRSETWRVILAVVVGLLLLQAIAALMFVPAALLVFVAFATAVFFFGRAWLGEFSLLMRMDDDIFPGRSDKLIWAILLIVVPPVGLYLFRAYRLAHWPETKPVSPVHDLF